MTVARAAAAVTLLVAACDRAPPPPPPVTSNAAANAPVTERGATPVAGCADRWEVTLDLPSFGNNGGGRSFLDTRLEDFRAALETSVRAAVSSACADGAVDPAKAAAVGKLDVQSASGAADPTFFAGRDGSVVSLQWTFAENDLTIPSEMELREGLVCWTDPASGQCAERAP